MPDFTAEFLRDGSRLTVIPSGQLDTATSPMLEQQLFPELKDVADLILDFEKVEYISSGGLRLVLLTEQEMEQRAGSMTLIHVNDHVRTIFDMAGFLQIIHLA
jgi:anti-anti-sigma factor